MSLSDLMLFAIALVFGLVLGLFLVRLRRDDGPLFPDPGAWISGLNYLLGEQRDVEIEAFLAALPVSEQSLDTHLAMGALVRRRGELEKAIRVHQHLIERPDLPAPRRAQCELELARDYLAAGLFGRAEELLTDLVEVDSALRTTALLHLLEIYEREREWPTAIATAERVQGTGETSVATRAAHYHCELALAASERGDAATARAEVEQALARDPEHTRARMMLGQQQLALGEFEAARELFARVLDLEPRMVVVLFEDLMQVYEAAGDPDALVGVLRERDLATASLPILEFVLQRLDADADGDAITKFLLACLREDAPSEVQAAMLMALARRGMESAQRPDLADGVAGLAPEVAAGRNRGNRYQCDQCGIRGGVMHWQCPGCHYWGTTLAITRSAQVSRTP